MAQRFKMFAATMKYPHDKGIADNVYTAPHSIHVELRPTFKQAYHAELVKPYLDHLNTAITIAEANQSSEKPT